MLETFLKDLGPDEGITHSLCVVLVSLFFKIRNELFLCLCLFESICSGHVITVGLSRVFECSVLTLAFLIKVKVDSAHCHSLLGKPCEGQIKTQNAGRCEWALLQEGDIRPKVRVARNRTKKDSKLGKLIKQNWNLNPQEDTVGETQGRNTAWRNTDGPGTSTNSHRRKRGNSRQEGDTAERN